MKNFLIVKPSFDNGNIGDTALINTLKYFIKSHKFYIPQSKNELNNMDISKFTSLIYFGNDCVPYYPSCIPILKIKDFLKVNKKVHVINTSWGINPKGLNHIKSIANNQNFQIYMRDKYSYELIKNDINFYNSPVLTADLAFLCKINSNEKIHQLEDWINKSNKPIIGINTHNDFKEYNKPVENELRKFINNNKHKYRYLFIPHDSRKKEYENLQTLCKSCNDIDGYTTTYLDPEYEKHITSKLFTVITGRMHLAILTIPNNVPVIGISYNGLKAKGSFEHFGIEDLVIEPKNINTLNDKIEYITINYKKIQDTIKSNHDKVKNFITKYINDILV